MHPSGGGAQNTTSTTHFKLTLSPQLIVSCVHTPSQYAVSQTSSTLSCYSVCVCEYVPLYPVSFNWKKLKLLRAFHEVIPELKSFYFVVITLLSLLLLLFYFLFIRISKLFVLKINFCKPWSNRRVYVTGNRLLKSLIEMDIAIDLTVKKSLPWLWLNKCLLSSIFTTDINIFSTGFNFGFNLINLTCSLYIKKNQSDSVNTLIVTRQAFAKRSLSKRQYKKKGTHFVFNGYKYHQYFLQILAPALLHLPHTGRLLQTLSWTVWTKKWPVTRSLRPVKSHTQEKHAPSTFRTHDPCGPAFHTVDFTASLNNQLSCRNIAEWIVC
jgi:hypothetical protein